MGIIKKVFKNKVTLTLKFCPRTEKSNDDQKFPLNHCIGAIGGLVFDLLYDQQFAKCEWQQKLKLMNTRILENRPSINTLR